MRLDLITSKDDLRPILGFVLLTPEHCVATDTDVLGVIPTKEIFDNDFIIGLKKERVLVHREDWKKFYNADIIVWADRDKLIVKIHYTKSRPVLVELSTEDKEEIKYPRWEQVIPKKEGETSKMCLSVDYLFTLAKALGYAKGLIRLSHCGDKRAMYVESIIQDTESYGIIMPVMDKE